MKNKYALLLCGGTGSRMGDLTKNTPKPLLKVKDKPIIWYAFNKLINSGFSNIILPLGYKGDLIKKYLQSNFGDKCNLFFEETGEFSPISQRIGLVKHLIPDNESFFILNSDTIFDFDIEKMFNYHIETKSLVTLSTTQIVSPWGIMTIKDDKLISFDRERKVQTLYSSSGVKGLINSGLAWIDKSALNLIDLFSDIDFETELFKKVILLDKAVYYEIEGLWIPIDTPKDLALVNLNDELL